MRNEKQAVALSSIFASALITAGKAVVGLMTGSLGLLSETLHSLLDLGAATMTYMAVRVSDKPADDVYHYGLGKIESIAALAETGLLFLTCFWIFYEAAHRLITRQLSIEVTWWSVIVMVVSIAIDISRSRALSHVAKKTRSQALEADALHFSSDVYSSAVVLVGLGLTYLGWPEGDAIAAIGVGLFVCVAGWRLGRRTIDTLIDAAPEGATEKIKAIVGGIPAVIRINRIRVRPGGSVLFVDLDIAVSRGLPLDRVAAMKRDIVAAIQASMSEAEVTIASSPIALDNETVHERVGIIASNQNLSVHHVTVHQVGGKLSISLDLEIEGSRTLGEAHAQATHLEDAIRAELGDDVEVETHIEPGQTREIQGADVEPEALKAIKLLVRECAASIDLIKNVHDVRARQTPHGMVIIFHCLVEPRRSVAEVHAATDALERRIHEKCPDAWRVVGHAEPSR